MNDLWQGYRTETLADYIVTPADLSTVDPWELYLFLALPRPMNVWFYNQAFAPLARGWLIGESHGIRSREALLLRFGFAITGEILSWAEIGRALSVTKARAKELVLRGLVDWWREQKVFTGTLGELLPHASRVVSDFTVEDDRQRRAGLGPAKTGLWNPRYAKTCSPITREALCPWRR